MNVILFFRMLVCVALSLVVCFKPINVFAQQTPQKIAIRVELAKPVGDMTPVWAWFGYDEPNYTYMKDGKKLLGQIADLSPVPVFVRAHNLLTTGDGTPALKWGSTNAYTEDAVGNPIYNWKIVDSIFDTYVQRGMKPMAQIGFMPEALSSKPQPYQHQWKPGDHYTQIFKGWTFPPKDYNKWAELVYQWVKHCVERYGPKEVESWYWELWNEPNIGYWSGTLEEYCKLYDYSAAAVKRALPSARMGGPHSTGPSNAGAAAFLKGFLDHVTSGKNYVTGKTGSPIDFVAFHAKGAPRVVSGHVRMNMGTQLRDIQSGFSIVASYPKLRKLPIIIGESDPEGCAACGMATNPENAYRNGTMYSSYTAASFARKYALADSIGINFKGAVSWSFEFENQPWFYGFRDLATNGVAKPVLNVFRMFGMMSGKRVQTFSSGGYPLRLAVDSSFRGPYTDVNALAATNNNEATILLWNYHDDDVRDAGAMVEVQVNGLPQKPVLLHHYRIDTAHSNAYEKWKAMGSPQNPTAEQIAFLEKEGDLTLLASPQWLQPKQGGATVPMHLPRQGVSLLKFTW